MYQEEYLEFPALTLDHIDDMDKWGFHKNPLLFDYNVRFRDKTDKQTFYRAKTLSPFNRYFAIYYKEEMMGFIGLKAINPLSRNSTLGLVMNPSQVGKGFGTFMLEKFLNMYFNELNMNKMTLVVASYNTRAFRLYKNMGFKEIKEFYDVYPNKEPDFTSDYVRKHRDKFDNIGSTWYFKAIKMELRKEEYNAIHN